MLPLNIHYIEDNKPGSFCYRHTDLQHHQAHQNKCGKWVWMPECEKGRVEKLQISGPT